MAIEERLKHRIESLLAEASGLATGNPYGQVINEQHRQQCSAWIAAAQNAVQLACPKDSPYTQRADSIAARSPALTAHRSLGELAELLRSMLVDAEAGLIASVANQAIAETFDDFLDHATAYLDDGCVKQAGVIAGVVFEDTIKGICRKVKIEVQNKSLESLINALKAQSLLTSIQAKRAKAAADLRGSAGHASWDEFGASDVSEVISFTKELVASKLDN